MISEHHTLPCGHHLESPELWYSVIVVNIKVKEDWPVSIWPQNKP